MIIKTNIFYKFHHMVEILPRIVLIFDEDLYEKTTTVGFCWIIFTFQIEFINKKGICVL